MLAMIAKAKASRSFGSALRARFIGDYNPRFAALSREKLAHETLGSLGISTFLDKASSTNQS
jgi:hypothetical protein